MCQRGIKTNRELLQHLSFCRKRNRENNINSNTAIDGSNSREAANDKSDSHNSNRNGGYKRYFWNDVRGTVFKKNLNDAYEKMAYWKQNLFMMPSGAAGKKYIEEITFLLKLWIQDSPLKSIALWAIHIMPALLLQKPSKNLKLKDHLVSETFKIMGRRNISNLVHEGETIQERMKINVKGMNIEKISLKFKNMMSKGNVNEALKLLMENMLNGILPLNDKTLKMLKQKQPEGNEPLQEVLLQGPV